MSRENLDVVRAVNEAWASGDVDRAMGYLNDDVAWEAIEEAPDAGTYRGHAGVRAYFEDWLGDFRLEMELGEAMEAGEKLVCPQHAVATSKGSGLATEMDYAVVYSFRDGKILAAKEYRALDQALEAVGLRE